MADLRDFTGKNRRFTGVSGVTVSSGANTANRVDEAGRLRFNTSNNLMEYYTGTEWKAIDAPPTISTIAIDGGSAAASGFVDNSLSGNASIVISGSLFDTSNAVVLLEATSGSNISPATTTINSSTQITIGVSYSDFINANEPYSVKVSNPSGLSVTLPDAVYVDTVPTFTNAADTIFSIFDSTRGSVSIAADDLCGATDAEGDTISYAVTVGALPSGLTMASATGAITGSTSAVGSDTTTTFSVTASQTGGGNSNTRQFKIVQKAPVVDTFTSSDTFAVPTGVTTVDVLVVAGGGGSGPNHAGGGGGGGLIYRPGFPVAPGTPISVTVSTGSPPGHPQRGTDSVFSNLTAKGGGGGKPGGFDGANFPGGSGSGGSHNPSESRSGGSATQPGQPGDSGTYGFGNPGGGGNYNGNPGQGAQGGGGGGAGAGGNTAGANTPGNGGAGRAYSISGSSVYYAGGGAGGGHQNDSAGSGGIGGGGNHGPGGSQPGNPGTANRGGGGGGSADSSGSPNGGSGIVIVTY